MVLMFGGSLSRSGIVIQHTAFATTDRGIAGKVKGKVELGSRYYVCSLP